MSRTSINKTARREQPFSSRARDNIVDYHAEIDELINKFRAGKKFAVLVGAGISRAAGIKTGDEIVQELRLVHHEIFQNDEDRNYSSVMRKAIPDPSDRRKYFEKMCAGKRPTDEHYILATLLDKRKLRMVLSTNFDYLLEMAAINVCERRPRVFLHDSRFTAEDLLDEIPTLGKLHGDFLFDDIANLEEEMRQHLSEDMRNKLSAALDNSGLIVLGYGGNDQTIIQFLEEVGKRTEALKYGLWWVCHGHDCHGHDCHGHEAACDLHDVFERIGKLTRKTVKVIKPAKGDKIDAADFLKTLCTSIGLRLPRPVPFRQPAHNESTFMRGVQTPSQYTLATKMPKELLNQIRRNKVVPIVGFSTAPFIGQAIYRHFGRKRVFYFDYRFATLPIREALISDLEFFGERLGIHYHDYPHTSNFLTDLFGKGAVLFLNHLPSTKDNDYFINEYLLFVSDILIPAVLRADKGKLIIYFSPDATLELARAWGGDESAIRRVNPSESDLDNRVKSSLGQILINLPSQRQADLIELLRVLSQLIFGEDRRTLKILSRLDDLSGLLEELCICELCDEQDGKYVANEALRNYVSRNMNITFVDRLSLAVNIKKMLASGPADTLLLSFEAERLFKTAKYYDEAFESILKISDFLMSRGRFGLVYYSLEYYLKERDSQGPLYFRLSAEQKLWLAYFFSRAYVGLSLRTMPEKREYPRYENDLIVKGLKGEKNSGYLTAAMALGHLLLGDVGLAEKTLIEAEPQIAVDGPSKTLAFVQVRLAMLTMQNGPPALLDEIRQKRWPKARVWIEKGKQTYREIGDEEGHSFAMLEYAGLNLQAQEFNEAEDTLNKLENSVITQGGFTSQKAHFYSIKFALKLRSSFENAEDLKLAEGYYYLSNLHGVAAGDWTRLIQNMSILFQFQLLSGRPIPDLDAHKLYLKIVENSKGLLKLSRLPGDTVRVLQVVIGIWFFHCVESGDSKGALQCLQDTLEGSQLLSEGKNGIVLGLSLIGIIQERLGSHENEILTTVRKFVPQYCSVVECFLNWLASPEEDLHQILNGYGLERDWYEILNTWRERI
jgi:hypothetical protein